MKFRFPLNDVTIKITEQKKPVNLPLFSDDWSQVNQHEYSLDIEGVAWFYACNGNYIEVCLYEGYNRHSLELYLNGSIFGAILHQRMILPLHGSSFNYKGNGIMVCGDSGVGKSSVTAAFCLSGSQFLTDDVTPMAMNNGKPTILTLSDRIKLWEDTLEQLSLQKDGLEKIEPEIEKFYFPMDVSRKEMFPLNWLFILEIHDSTAVEFQDIRGADKAIAIRNQIYRLEYLQGMPENETAFFPPLVEICNNVSLILVKRPAVFPVNQLMTLLKNHIDLHS